MKANEKSFLSFLQGLNQYLIPIYQRKYSWSEEECEQLWDDVVFNLFSKIIKIIKDTF